METSVAHPISGPLQALAAAALALLEQLNREPAAQNILSLSPAPAHGLALADLVNEFAAAKAQARRARTYCRKFGVTLGGFARGREARHLATITSREIGAWLAEQPWADKTRRGALLDLRNLFNFAIRRGYLLANPALGVDLPEVLAAPPGIHTPVQAAQVLAIARLADLNLCRSLALRYFAGLRQSEAVGIREEDIQPARGLIFVRAELAKTRKRRLVEISPNLGAWLALGGQLPLKQVANRHAALVASAAALGIPWPRNAPRHSFCSYHLAAGQNAAQTALAAGHSETMLFAHYRELVTPAEAQAYFQIWPATLKTETPAVSAPRA